MTRGALAARAAVALVCLAAVVQPVVHAAPPRVAGWTITRTGRGPAPLTGWFNGRSGSSGATAALFALTGSGRDRRLSGAFTTTRIDWGVDGWPRVYGDLQPDCPPPTCTDPYGGLARFGFSSNGHATDATVYVATREVIDVEIELTSPGWRVSRWTPSMRVVATDEAGGTGARALHTTVGGFGDARAKGGRYGSLGWGRLPCDTHGDGSGELTGGRRRMRLTCHGAFGAADGVPGPTEWHLTGEVTGVGSMVNVLLGVDFPRERR